MKYKAFLFDLNGTMVDDMKYHIDAWHRILNEFGAGLTWEQTRSQCYGRNDELLERVFPGRFSPEEKDAITIDKETQYQKEFRPHLRLLDGLPQFLEVAREKNIKMAIGSAAILFNVNFVVEGLALQPYIDAIVSAEDVRHSKPDPSTFLQCASLLGVDPSDCLVFEDAPKGVEAAERAGMDSVVLTTMHDAVDFNLYSRIIAFAADYNDPSLLAKLGFNQQAVIS